MNEINARLTDKNIIPTDEIIKPLIGVNNFKLWQKLKIYIDEKYPGVFKPDDWCYGGQKHGWSLRYKKSKSFCTLIPEKKKLFVLIVFGLEERGKAKLILPSLSGEIQTRYNDAATYHDGKWVLIPLKNEKTLEEIKTLLTVKRKPKP